jgi:hypothetical protein
MKSYIRRLLREGIINIKSYKLLTEKERRVSLNRLSLILEKEIRVGDTLTKKLETIASPLSKKILNFLKGNNIKDGVNVKYVDYNKDNEKLLTLGYEDREGKIRERLFKLNKLIKYLGGNLSDIKGYEIEDLISFFKKADTSQLKVVEGDTILDVFHCENYDEGKDMGSCMRFAKAQKYLEIYKNNPNQIKCLVLFNPENGKVRGRALLFKMDNGITFMDRIYTTNKEYNSFFNTYAEENNLETGVPSDTVTLENGGKYDYYPYLDTFRFYTPPTGVLSTAGGELELQDIEGGDSLSGRWSEYHGETIPRDQAAYIEHMGDWFWDTDVGLSWDNEFVFKNSNEVIKLDAGEYKGKYALRDDVVKDINDEWIKSDEANKLSAGQYVGEYALRGKTVNDINGDTILRSESVELTDGQYMGEYCLDSEAWVLDNGNIIHEDDVNDYKDEIKEKYI